MKPLVFYAQTKCFDSVTKFWHIVRSADDRASKTEVSREEAEACIKEHSLPLAYQDENGRVWADPADNPYMYIKARRMFDKDTRRKLNTQRKRILDDFGDSYTNLPNEEEF